MENSIAKAYTEVLEILKYIPATEYVKLPYEKILEMEINRDKDYEFIYDASLSLDEQNVSEDAKAIITILFKNYFANESQKAKLEKILIKNEEKLEEEKKAIYSYDNIFDNSSNSMRTENKKNLEEKDNIENMDAKVSRQINNEELPVKKDNGIFKNIINKIKRIFIKY